MLLAFRSEISLDVDSFVVNFLFVLFDRYSGV